jgi:zinc/manganese transport system ATP-binding protein
MPKPSPKTKTKTASAVQVQNLTVQFGDFTALQNISFLVESGKIAAVIGPNGSGKTTLIKTILGLIKPTAGTIEIFGSNLHDSRSLVGYVPQRFEFDKTFPITVHEFMNLHRHTHVSEKMIDEKIKEVGLTPLILQKKLGDLSGGQLQRVLIASAIVNSPSLLVLDEPSTGVDIVGEAAFYDVIEHLNREHHTTVLIVSHDISMVSRLVDQVICVNEELLCSGAPHSALTQKKLTDLYGGSANLFEHTH